MNDLDSLKAAVQEADVVFAMTQSMFTLGLAIYNT